MTDDSNEQELDPNVAELVRLEAAQEAVPVGPPHWQALVDLKRVLPCEVLPANTKVWKTAVDVVKDNNSDQLVVITDEEERLYERDIRTPILVRTKDTGARSLH